MRPTLRATSLILMSALAASACSGSGGGDDGGDAADKPSCAPSQGKVELTFTSWVPEIQSVVDAWNAKNPDIQVKVQTGPSGNAGTYQNFFNQLKAGNAPDLGQVEYDALPSFRVQDGLTDLGGCDIVAKAQSQFVDWTWNQVSFGEQGSAFGIPQDAGPMAMFYRKDLFEQNGIKVPTTWQEYADAAEKVKAAGGYITNFSQSDINQFAGLAWQNGGRWFANDGQQWTVTMADDKTRQVADYWQDLLSRKLVSTVPPWTTEWDNAYNSGSAWTWVSAVWGANSIASGAPKTAGKWRVAPMPQWTAGGASAGNWGGSATSVFKSSKHPYEAAQFALWLNTSEEALTLLNEKANEIFAKEARNVLDGWTYLPFQVYANSVFNDTAGKAYVSDTTLSDGLRAWQDSSIEYGEQQGFTVGP